VGPVGAYHQSAFRADLDHLKPYVADFEPMECAWSSAADNPNSASTAAYPHDFCPAQDQVFVYPHRKFACRRTARPTLGRDNQFPTPPV
jgi:hypothetical protein